MKVDTKFNQIAKTARANPDFVENPIARLFIPELSIIKKAKENPEFVFNSIAHLISPELLKESFKLLRRKAATGTDGVSYTEYENNLDDNIQKLHKSLKDRSYKATALKRVWIDKGKGKKRPLGISNIEDKIVQRAVTTLLNLIYEQDFYDFSYGFREDLNAHQALHYFRNQSMRHKIKWFINADIKGCFDNFDHRILLEILNKRVNDGAINWLIKQWLETEIIDGKEMTTNKSGTPQGGI
ncbi:MAG: reverse transcriptase domain-containing protein, partial [Chloroflexota bacterium]|nr:reverse transcriptase domain-containing protein [Chloroflexota bacterium]